MLVQLASAATERDACAEPTSGSNGAFGDRPEVHAAFVASRAGMVSVRPARIADMLRVEPLINRFAADGLMLPKTPEQLARNFREFVVAFDSDDTLLGCGALRVYTPQLAEIVSLAVHDAAQGRGVGRRLVEALVVDARQLGIGTVFALTLQDVFFHRSGFRTVPKELFPPKVWADCRTCSKLHACDEIAVVREL